VSYTPPDLSIPQERPNGARTVVYARDGSILEVIAPENRVPVTLDRIPLQTRWAFLAAEDHRFYEHKGIDGFAVARAIRENRKAGKVVEGASTITQQYAKNVYFLGEDRTPALKLREAAVALELERRMTKDEILAAYLNTIYLGAGAYGVEAASEAYFSKSVSELTLGEGALLAGLARSPEGANPLFYPDDARARRDTVLDQMVQFHLLDDDNASFAKSPPLNLKPAAPQDRRFPYFADYVRQAFLDEPRFGVTSEDRAWFLFRGGLEIHTTVDPLMMAKAETAASETLPAPEDPDVGMVTLNPHNGEVLALVGGRDYQRRRFNLATQAERQAGSAFKTFTLVAAVEQGMNPATTYLDSTPRTFYLSTGEAWPVNNYDGYGYGRVTLEQATVGSFNAAFAELGLKIKPAAVAEEAKRMGIRSPVEPYPAMVLGGLEHGVSPLDMASAYGTLANNGSAVKPTPIAWVKYADGRVIDGHDQPQREVAPSAAYIATQVLQGVIARGTGRRANIGRPAAGKTGTTSDFADAWFVGYTPQLATAVWVGYPEGRIAMYDIYGVNVAGGTYPAEIWGNFMSAALADTPPQDFRKPIEDYQRISIDPNTGLLARPWCKGVEVEIPRVFIPRESCPQPPPQPVVVAVASTPLTPTAGVTPTVPGDVTPSAPGPVPEGAPAGDGGAAPPSPSPSPSDVATPSPAPAPPAPGDTRTASAGPSG